MGETRSRAASCSGPTQTGFTSGLTGVVRRRIFPRAFPEARPRRVSHYRHHMRNLHLAVGLSLAACLGVGQEARAQSFQITPAEWDQIADRYEPCALGSPPADSAAYVTWSLNARRGARLSLSLPAALREVASRWPDERHWMAPDSSRVEVTVMAQPSGAMAAGGEGVEVDVEGACALPVAGHRATVHRIRLTDTRTRHIRYAAAVDALVRPGIAISAMVESPNVGGRDAMIRAFGALKVEAAKQSRRTPAVKSGG